MKNFIKIGLFCVVLITLPMHSIAARTPAEPFFQPSTQHKLGLGAAFVLPRYASPSEEENDKKDVSHYYNLHVMGSYALVSFKKSYLSLDGNITYNPASIEDKQLGLTVKDQHIRLCLAIGYTSKLNESFYCLATNFLGYEFDCIFNSQLTENGAPVTGWPSTKMMGNIVCGIRGEFFYGIYFDFRVTLPITELLDKVKKYKSNPFVKAKGSSFLREARYLTASWIDLGLGVNLLSIAYPPSDGQKG